MANRNQTIYEALARNPVHPFPARMAAGIVSEVLSRSLRRLRVLDPMMGSGTVLALAHSVGHKAIGVDVDPLAVLITRVWTTPVDTGQTRAEAQLVLNAARETFSSLSLRDAYPMDADPETRKFIRYWFDDYARRQLAALSIAIRRVKSKPVQDALWCAFSRLIITKQAGASLAMDLAHSRPHKSYERAPAKPFRKFLIAVDHVLKNCPTTKDRARPVARPSIGDARKLKVRTRSIDLVLTSPPYLNAIDYMRCSRFSLVWMGYSLAKLRHVRSQSVGSEIGSRQNSRTSKRVMSKLKLDRTLPRRQKAMLARYIDDMRMSLAEVSRVLVPGGVAMYVVGENTVRGIYIRNSKIITELARASGLRLRAKRTRKLPANRRYLPPPEHLRGRALDARMRREVILTFKKVRSGH